MKRVANDAQIERLVRALRRADQKPGLSDYGKQLAKKIAKRDKIKVASAERRLQRYITTAGERRSVYRAPVKQIREVRQIVRRYTPPTPVLPEPESLPVRVPRVTPRERELLPRYEPEHTSLYELRSILAYFDGNQSEAAKALRVDRRLLDFASQGIEISRQMGSGLIDQGVERLYGRLSKDDIQDIRDFSDFLQDKPDWEIKMILDHMASGESVFSDWLDLWRDNDMDTDSLEDDGEFWALWRQAYKSVTGK